MTKTASRGSALIRFFVVLLSLAGLALPTGAHAQQKHKVDLSPPQKSRYVKEHMIDAGDVPGHQLRIVEIEKIFTRNHPKVRGAKITKVRQWAFTNYTNGVGPVIFYETWSDDDGNMFFVEGDALTESRTTATGSRRGTSHGTARIVGGTGKFTSIQGATVGHTEFDSDPNNGYNRTTGRMEYWFRE